MLIRIVGVALVAGLAGCATAPEGALVDDPYEGLNRNVHSLNKGLDRAVVNPVSKAYDTVTPETIQFLVGNALSHLTLPGLFANHLLQGDFRDAGETLARFAVNTVGGVGFLDPATEIGASYIETDFGITLAEWGVGPGVYHELPVFGPKTTRDAFGTVVDFAFAPTTYLGGGTAETIGYSVTGLELVDTRDRYRAVIDEILYDSEDSYLSSRNTYIQNRLRLLAGETEVDALPDIFEEQQ